VKNLEALALEWGAEILERRWTTDRFRLEVASERTALRIELERQVYVARLRVWERVPSLVHARGQARLRVAGTDRALRITWEWAPDDGWLTVELDPESGARLAYRCEPFFRGSRRSGALARRTAVARARDEAKPPPGARIVRAQLTTSGGRRVWRIRWRVEQGDWVGTVVACLNARSGILAERAAYLRPALTLRDDERSSRAEAERELGIAVRIRLGSEVVMGPPVPGVILVKRVPMPAWMTAVTDAEGRVWRASVSSTGRVRIVRVRGAA